MVALNFTVAPGVSTNTVSTGIAPAHVEWPADCKLTDSEKAVMGAQSMHVGLMDTPQKVMSHWARVHEENAVSNAHVVKAEVAGAREAKRVAKAAIAMDVEAANLEWRAASRARKEADAKWTLHMQQLAQQRKAHMLELDAALEAARERYHQLRDAT